MSSPCTSPTTSTVIAAAVLAAALLCGAAARAQEANFPPGTPKLVKWSDLPDWDGIWQRGGPPGWNEDFPPRAPEQLPPYNAEYQQKFQQRLVEQRAIDLTGRGNTPYTSPRAGVMPGMMTMEFPMNVELNPREVAIWSPVSADPREIYTDGRRHPLHPFPSTKGQSIGHWEGKVLIVDTCCFRADTPLPGNGPHSDAMHVTERIWSPSPGVLKDAIVVEDPKAFTHPWTTTKTYYRRPTWEEVEDDTGQNDRPLPTVGESDKVSLSASELAALESASSAPTAPALEHTSSPPLKATDIEALQKASVTGGIDQAWESIGISNVHIGPTAVTWIGASSRFIKFHCTADPDGTAPACERAGPARGP